LIKNQVEVGQYYSTTEEETNSFSALIAHVKDKLNVTTTVRPRKDKIGKVRFVVFYSIENKILFS